MAAALAAGPAQAQDDDAFVTFRTLKPALALRMAEAAMVACRDASHQVGVSVVDRFGQHQVFLRDRFAGAHVVETAVRKAWTAVSFSTDTMDLDQSTRQDGISFGIGAISDALPLGGGVMVLAGDGSLVAGIGVTGAPGPELDDDCARAGIAAIEAEIAF